MKNRRAILVTGGIVLLVLMTWSWASRRQSRPTADRLLLLVPDGTSFSDPGVTVWLDGASEEGVHVTPVHDSEFVRPFFGESECAGLILPDSIHKRASDVLIATLDRFVAGGGRLMLVYDAGTLLLNGGYASGRSRLAGLAGLDYALYDSLGDKTIQWTDVKATAAVVRQMEIPPGKYYPIQAQSDASDSHDGSPVSLAEASEVQLMRYQYGDLKYPSFVTSGNYSGNVLFRSAAGVVAGEHSYQKGSVLFVNLPLGYLKGDTDGLLLHAFLKYFVGRLLSLPYLMSVPDGVGGLVLNWHVDSNAAIKPLEEMNSWSLLRQGPYSIHVTAGPDANRFGDRRGFDAEHNRVSQELIRNYVERGDEIGSHGGWIHDYFAAHVDKDNPKDLEQFLVLNKNTLEQVTGKRVTEYSAPEGNQPPWVTRWLEANGFVAYYFTGDTGMGPTQGYRDGTREGRNIWAFPILHLGRAAAFEEMSADGYFAGEVERWLEAIAEFAAQHRSVRLVYFHPPGMIQYRHLVDKWLQRTARMRADGRFRWYTMTELANFLNSRKQVNWKVSGNNELLAIEATHPQSLQHQAWFVPASKYTEPAVVQGSAEVVRDKNGWMVVAGAGKDLKFQARMAN